MHLMRIGRTFHSGLEGPHGGYRRRSGDAETMTAVDEAAIREAAGHLRTVLDEIDAGELACSPIYRRLLDGALIALESLPLLDEPKAP